MCERKAHVYIFSQIEKPVTYPPWIEVAVKTVVNIINNYTKFQLFDTEEMVEATTQYAQIKLNEY